MAANLGSSVYLNDLKESYMINKIVCLVVSKHTELLRNKDQ